MFLLILGGVSLVWVVCDCRFGWWGLWLVWMVLDGGLSDFWVLGLLWWVLGFVVGWCFLCVVGVCFLVTFGCGFAIWVL